MTTGTAKERIAVVDDEPMVREVVAEYLQRDGYDVDTAADGASALRMLAGGGHDLVVLDVMLPVIDGISVLRELRSTTEVPIILLTARSEETDRILGLDLGADDYVVKPFSPRELVARVRSVLRRTRAPDQGTRIQHPGLVVDLTTRSVHVDGVVVELTRREFDLLAFLAAHPGQVFSRNQLLEQVWESSAEWQDPSTVTVHIRRLRRKVEPEARRPRRLTTVWGVGYRFDP